MIKGKILAIDPGEKRIGMAISDESAMLARPFSVLKHVSREIDAREIAKAAQDNGVVLIIVGQALDSDNQVTPQGRKSIRLVDAINELTQIPVRLWDEGGSTQKARKTRLEGGAPKSRRSGHLDDTAAALILQDYLDAKELDK